MKRYRVDAPHYVEEHTSGPWVRYEDAAERIEELKAENERIQTIIKQAMRHLKITGGKLVEYSGTYVILSKAIDAAREEDDAKEN